MAGWTCPDKNKIIWEGDLETNNLIAKNKIVLTETASGSGAIIFKNSSNQLSSDSTNFFWDDTNKRLGIGTTTPISPLQVGDRAILRTATGGAVNDVHLGSNLYYDGTNWRYIATDEGTALAMDAAGQFRVFTTPSGTAGAIATLTERLTIQNTGNVGIGTTNPSSSWGTTKILDIAGATVPGLVLHPTGSAQESSMISGGNGLYFDVGGHATALGNNDIIFRTEETNSQFTPTEKVRITSTGNVGIGTTSPDEKLEVSGAILINNQAEPVTPTASCVLFASGGLLYAKSAGGNLTLLTAS